jgi:hypothetical protein
MATEVERLIQEFALKDEVENYINNLNKLKEDGSVSEEQFAEMKEEYDQRLSAVKTEITGIKNELKKQLEAKQREKETYEWEIGRLEVKYKVGELPMDKYLNNEKKLRAEAQLLEAECEELNKLIKADSAADIGIMAQKSQAAISKLPSRTKTSGSTSQIKPDREKRRELSTSQNINISGGRFNLPPVNLLSLVTGLLLLISVFLPWIAASEILGSELGSDSGRQVSGIIGLVGILGGLVIIGTSFLPNIRLRSILHTIIGIVALVALGYLIFSGTLPILSEYARTLMVIREGFYLYLIFAAALIVISILERRGISYTFA